MSRLAFLILALFALLAAPATAQPIDQETWVARKQQVTLPNGQAIHYVELGDRNGTPVLLLHGFTDSSRVWTMLTPQLERHRLIVPDLRGHGGSAAPACCYGLSNFAEDMRLLLDALRIERTAVAGHSLGSMIAQQLAADHPGRVTRLALIGSTALVPVQRGDWLWEQVMALTEPVSAHADFLRQWGYGSSPTPVDPVLTLHAGREAEAVPLHVWRAVPRELLGLPVGRFAPEVRAPVLILSGGSDPVFTAEHHQSLVAAYPGAQAHVFAGLGHNFVVERPEQVGPVLARFLAGN